MRSVARKEIVAQQAPARSLSPPASAAELRFPADGWLVRGFAAEEAGRHGLCPRRAALFVLAVSGLVAHVTAEPVTDVVLRVWPAPGTLECDVAATGTNPPDLRAGFVPPGPVASPDDGLWLARRLSATLEIRPTVTGVSARLSFARGRDAEDEA